jgi:hypothetical protein
MEKEIPKPSFTNPDELPDFLKGRFKFIPPKDDSAPEPSPNQQQQQHLQQPKQLQYQHQQQYQQYQHQQHYQQQQKQNFHKPNLRESSNKFQRPDKRNNNVQYNNTNNINNTNYAGSNSGYQSFNNNNKHNHNNYRFMPPREQFNITDNTPPSSTGNVTMPEDGFAEQANEQTDEAAKSKPISLFR